MKVVRNWMRPLGNCSPCRVLEQIPNELKKGAIWYRVEGGESLGEEVKQVFLNDVLSTVSFLMGDNHP
jgi:hypothetical protein